MSWMWQAQRAVLIGMASSFLIDDLVRAVPFGVCVLFLTLLYDKRVMVFE